MKAALLDYYAKPANLRIGEITIPQPKAGQIRIKVKAAAINPRDWLLCEGKYIFRHVVFGFPKVIGSDVSGIVDAVGSGVCKFKVGDSVVAMQTPLGQMGGYAEYFVVDEKAVGRKSHRMSFEEGAGLPVAGLTALQMLRDDADVKAGETVAVIGASGGVGHYAVQIARYMGAKVIAVAGKDSHPMLLNLGVHQVIDRHADDMLKQLANIDVVIDAFGRGALAQYSSILNAGGRYVTTVPNLQNAKDAFITRFYHKKKLQSKTTICDADGDDLDILANFADAGFLRTVIDSTYPFVEVNSALAKSRSFGVKGKLILQF